MSSWDQFTFSFSSILLRAKTKFPLDVMMKTRQNNKKLDLEKNVGETCSIQLKNRVEFRPFRLEKT